MAITNRIEAKGDAIVFFCPADEGEEDWGLWSKHAFLSATVLLSVVECVV